MGHKLLSLTARNRRLLPLEKEDVIAISFKINWTYVALLHRLISALDGMSLGKQQTCTKKAKEKVSTTQLCLVPLRSSQLMRDDSLM